MRIALLFEDDSVSDFIQKLTVARYREELCMDDPDPLEALQYAQSIFQKLSLDIYGATQLQYCTYETLDAYLEFRARIQQAISECKIIPPYRLENITVSSIEFISMKGDIVAVLD